MSDFNEKQVDRKISEMVSFIIRYHHTEGKVQSNIEVIKELLEFAIKNRKESEIDYLTLTIEELRAIKEDYYESVLKKCKISIFMENINDISLSELIELKQKYKVHYFSIKDLSKLDDSYQISLDLVYKYKRAIQKIIDGIDDNFLKGQQDREKVIFGILIPRILENTEYDFNSQEDYEKKSKLTRFGKPTFDHPSNEMIGLINGKCVCRGYAGIVRDVFRSVGIETCVITGLSKECGHAWNQIKLDEEWYNIDVTWDWNSIFKNGKSYWLLKGDKQFELGYLVQDGDEVKEWSHKMYSINRTPGNVCTRSLSDEELAMYIDFSDLRKKKWLRESLKNVSLEQIKSSVTKFLQNMSKMNNHDSSHKKR